MVLHPLAQVGIGVFVAVRIRCSQFMMDVLGNGKWSQCQQKKNQAYRKPASAPGPWGRESHRGAHEYHKGLNTVKITE